MVEREHGAGRVADAERDEAPSHPVGFDPGQGQHASEPKVADAREEERHRRVMASTGRVMRKHRNVFAALAESERRDRTVEAGPANIRRALAG